MTFTTFYLLIGTFVLGMCVSIILWTIRNGISPMPTSSKAKRYLLHALPKLREGTIYELGSGWGTLAFPIARSYPHLAVIGLESSPAPFFVSRLRSFFENAPNIQLRREDFFSVPLADASLIVCYLYPGAMQKLKIKFIKELKPGTLIISNTFAIPGWQPEKVIEIPDLYHSKIYIYKIAQEGEHDNCKKT